MNNKHWVALLFSAIIGHVYFQIMESSIPTNANCSYMASPVTDLLAFIWGFIVIYYGIIYDNVILTTLGGSVIVEHIYQLKRK